MRVDETTSVLLANIKSLFRVHGWTLKLLPRESEEEYFLEWEKKTLHVSASNRGIFVCFLKGALTAYNTEMNCNMPTEYVDAVARQIFMSLSEEDLCALIDRFLGLGAYTDEVLFTEGMTMRECQEKICRVAMRFCGDNQTNAAKMLGIARETLRSILKNTT